MALRKNVILRRPQSGRLEGRTRAIQLETETLPGFPSGRGRARFAERENSCSRACGAAFWRQCSPKNSSPNGEGPRAPSGRPLRSIFSILYNERPAWLDNAHHDLDAAVAAAYGWPADISEEDALSRLLALNLERAAAPR